MWLYFIRAYVGAGLFFYFKSIKVYDIENVVKNKPVLLLSNHQNALLDALIIAVKSGRFSYFLTRAGVFNKPFVAKLLKSFQMLPVYRVRDGWGKLSNNEAIFEACSKLLNNGASVVIFPEGNHSLKRMVRPLSKGFTRIVFETLETYPTTNLQLVPVGLNYAEATSFPDSASIYFGKPIAAKPYYLDDRNAAIVKLKAKIQAEIGQLTTDIPKANYEVTIEVLKRLEVDFLNPKAVNTCVASNLQNCVARKVVSSSVLKPLFLVLLKCAYVLPFLIWRYMVKPKIKDIEFIATFRFAMVIILAPLWLISLFVILLLTLGWHVAVAYVLISLCIALLAVKL
ncbi:lysophospholipid acyltransferase family protein [Algibacter amylolyticus]|uniref:lysophospholipid acyltransferase family protein n=1 Tax=Algibacter amylolyticus TaxID=1608400 RepID=UPI00155A7AA2|nr:lysophospholipid acyltransferase family protein [Algibacter amylolyticus]